jgi:outer membrane lipoprotein
MARNLLIIAAVFLALPGCADRGLFSATQSQDAIRVEFEDLRQSPQNHLGKKIILGGVIVKTTNTAEGTLIEIYQTRLDSSGTPVEVDISQGRFLGLYEGFLDSKIYRPDRKITVLGLAQGEKTLKLDEIDYRYPFLKIIELNLFQEKSPLPRYPYYWDYYPWDPWHPGYRYHPYWRY